MDIHDIKKFVAEHSGVSEELLSPGTAINEDLCIVGDDALELLEEFSKRFNVDLSDLNFEKYFPGEASPEMQQYLMEHKNKHEHSIFEKITNAIMGPFWRRMSVKYNYYPINIEMLYSAALNHRWKY